MFLLYTNVPPINLDNIHMGYADDSTLLAEVSMPGRSVPQVLSIRVGFFKLNLRAP